MSEFFDDGGFIQTNVYEGPPYETINLQVESTNQLKLGREMRISNYLELKSLV